MAAGYDDPAVQRRRLRVELRNARTGTGKTQRDVAKAMDWSVSKLIRIESGEVAISRNDLRALLEHYGISDKRKVDQLLEAASVARKESWSRYRSVHSSAFLTYLGFESSAWIIRNYESAFVPGLLQTEEYSWAVQHEVYGASDDDARLRWEAREERQELHKRDKPLEMYFLLDEAVIRRPVGGPKVMREQLQRLKDWTDESHISLQVLPFEVGAYRGMGVPFILLEFQDPKDEEVLYWEHATERTIRDEPHETGPYLELFLSLENVALPRAETRTLLDQVIDEIDAAEADNAERPQEAQS